MADETPPPTPEEPAPKPRGGDRRSRRPSSGKSGDRPRFDGGGVRREKAGDDERGRKRGGAGRLDAAQPFRPPRKAPPRRPALPEERPFIPREAWRDLRATVPPNVLDEVVKAVGAAAEAMESGDIARGTELLTWAKSVAPRSATLREALGIAHYAAERYAEAHAELLTYRRLSAAHDQNHLLADCARAMGRPEKMAEYVDDMIAARVDPSRIAEGLLVLTGERTEHGDHEGALQILRRGDLDPAEVQPWHPRLWYLAGDISEKLGRTDDAREYFEAITAVDPDFGDVEERIAALSS